MKCSLFFLIFLKLFSYNVLSNLMEVKVYNISSFEEVKENFKNFKINKIQKTKNGFKLEIEPLKDKVKKDKKSHLKKKGNYFDYLWFLILPFFITLYFFLTGLAERLLFMPFDPYEKYKNSVNFLLRKNKRNKRKLFLILEYFKNYLYEKLKIALNTSNKEILIKLNKLGFDNLVLKDLLEKIEEIKDPSYILKNEELNTILEQLENIILKIDQKDEEL